MSERSPSRITLRARRAWWITAPLWLFAALFAGLVPLLWISWNARVNPVLMVAVSALMLGVDAALCRIAAFTGEHLTVARDGVRYAAVELDGSAVRTVVALDRARGEVRFEPASAAGKTVAAIPGLPRGAGPREAALDRIEEAIRTRPPRVADALLEAPSLASIRATLGLDAAAAGPFRAAADGLTPQAAAALIDDRAASRAELVAASLVLATRGGDDGRRRVLRLADDCADGRFARLLRAVATDDPGAEASYRALRGDPGPLAGIVEALADRLVGLASIGAAAAFALPRASGVGLLVGVAVVGVLGELRRRAAAADLVARWTGFRLRKAAPWQRALGFALATAALALAPGAVPAALAPIVLYLALWAPSLLTLRRVEADEGEAAANEVAPPAAEDVEAVTRVRIEAQAQADEAADDGDEAASPAPATRAREKV